MQFRILPNRPSTRLFNRSYFNRPPEVSTVKTITAPLTFMVRSVPAAIEKALTYGINVGATLQVDLQYFVQTSTTIQKTLGFEIQSEVALTKLLKFTVKTLEHSVTDLLDYNIKTVHPITASLEYAIVSTHSTTSSVRRFNRSLFNRPVVANGLQLIQKNLQVYVRATPAAIEQVCQYCVKMGVVVQKDLEFVVQAGARIDAPLEFAVKTSPSVLADMVYTIVVGTTDITKQLEFGVVTSTDVNKLLTYTVQSSISITAELTYQITAMTLIHEPELWKQTVDVVSPGVVDDYPCSVVVPYDSTMLADFADVRFGDDYTGAMYAASRVTYTPSTTATFCVAVPVAGQTSFTMYYGNQRLVEQGVVVDPTGAVDGVPDGVAEVNYTFLWRYRERSSGGV